MVNNKQNLKKLLIFINELSNSPGNLWFKDELCQKFSISSSQQLPLIDEIYEYCIKLIIREHAEKFYSDFKLVTLKEKLIEDFIRMEKFRREDNFEDFCLALFQQIEAIVNGLANTELHSYILQNKDQQAYNRKIKETGEIEKIKAWQLIFYTELKPQDLEKKLSQDIIEWDFSEKFKAVLYYHYFEKKIYNYFDFHTIFRIGYDLYQSRNLNHRGGKISSKQQTTIDKVQSQKHKYYFKFLGFIEDFTSRINNTI